MNEFTAELIGTMVLVLLGNGVVANVVLTGTKGNGGGWIVITTGWALAVFAGVVISGPYSGAHLNPAVSFGLAASGSFPWADVPYYILAQLLGAMMGTTLVWLMYKDHYQATQDPASKSATFFTSPAIPNKSSNFLSELLGTFVLILVILHFTEAEIINQQTPIGLGAIGAVPVAFLVWAIGLSLGGTTGYAINPVRDLGPRIMHSLLPIQGKGPSHWSYSWIPVIGPIAGALLAAGLFLLLA